MTKEDLDYVVEQMGNYYKAERIILAYEFLKEANNINVFSDSKRSIYWYKVALYIKGNPYTVTDAMFNSYEDVEKIIRIFTSKHPECYCNYSFL